MAANKLATNTPNRPRETPSWLNEACNYAITAAQKTLQHLCEASRASDLVRVIKVDAVPKSFANNEIAIAVSWILSEQLHVYLNLRVPP
jgi:hypothetical protein